MMAMKTNSKLSLGIVILIFVSRGALFPINGREMIMTKNTAINSSTANIERDYWPTKEWKNSTPEAQGINPVKLEQMMDFIYEYYSTHFAEDSLHSVILIYNGFIVLEAYPNPNYTQDTSHQLYSITKSIISILIGIAIDRGIIASLNQKVLEFFPNTTIANLDEQKQDITIKHLLTMTSGLDLSHLWSEKDPIQGILDLPMNNNPGTKWHYSNGPVDLLAAIIEISSRNSTLEFAQQYLFEPLGISEVIWTQNPQGVYLGGTGLQLRPRDMAKLGFLYLNRGTWNEQQVVSQEWIVTSTETQFFPSYSRELVGYGYLWWIYPELGIYYASGWNGQKIFVFPECDLVLVFTADQDIPLNQKLFYRHIIPALTNNTINPPNFVLFLLQTSVIAVIIVPVSAIVFFWIRNKKKFV
jgi:CubicO group peptidase (beta-lactamase class C family)